MRRKNLIATRKANKNKLFFKDPKILIDPTLKENRSLSVLIEEVTHAFFWDIPEKDVRKYAPRLAKIIKKAGWIKEESD